ncbi:hypothetical protein LCGC14_1350770 [marine sediment metagenome]|uniref:C2H2-type domain-containing protein n=1 Tax=marine sediment metagenome TaxID=412755 RepID=A0A0F9NDB4_9ZZZZ
MIKCKKCNRWFKTKRGCNIHNRMHKNIQGQEEPGFDMNEIKLFITSEIQIALKELNFNRSTIRNSEGNVGILPVKITKMPKFNPVESNKRLVVKELKIQLAKGINNILQKVGSFDDKINFYETPIGILV